MKVWKKILIVLAVICIILGAFFTYDYKKTIDLKNELNSYRLSFDKANDKTEIIEIINTLSTEEIKFSKKCNEEFNELRNDLLNWIIEDYNQSINENTIENLEKTSDKKLINSYKTNLQELDKAIKKDNILTEEEIETFSNNINKTIASYDKRLKEIEVAEKKAEEERIAKEKAEAEAAKKKAAEEAARKASQQSNKNSQTSSCNSSSSSNSSSNNKYSGSKTYRNPANGGWIKHTWETDSETGEKIPGSDEYLYPDGLVFDENGNFCFNLNDWMN